MFSGRNVIANLLSIYYVHRELFLCIIFLLSFAFLYSVSLFKCIYNCTERIIFICLLRIMIEML